MQGIVIKSTGSWYDILDDEGKQHKGRLRGKFKTHGLKVTNPIAVGDRVVFDVEAGESGTVVINEIKARENYIIRKSVHKAHQGHLIAANLDQTLLIVTMQQPRTSLGFIDRFLVSAEAFRIPAIIVFNKVDLYSDEDLEEVAKLVMLYDQLGYQSLHTSATEDLGIESVREALQNKKTLFSGHSGVGKSSLLNKLDTQLALRTAEISTYADKGVHTTTFAEMFQLSPDTFVIDTPGIKELGIFEIGEDELSHYFPEMRVLIGECKFHNCRHTHEPKCAVIEAVKSGSIATSRYNSYISMLQNDDSHR